MEVKNPVFRETHDYDSLGLLLDSGFGNFEIVVAEMPDPNAFIACYGVYNKETQIIESLTNTLSKAKYIARELHETASRGYSPIPESLQALLASACAVDDEPPTGKAN